LYPQLVADPYHDPKHVDTYGASNRYKSNKAIKKRDIDFENEKR